MWRFRGSFGVHSTTVSSSVSRVPGDMLASANADVCSVPTGPTS